MPGPIPVKVRQAIFRRSEKGHSVAQIAAECHLAERTVRHLLQQFRKQGQDASRPHYRRGPRQTSTSVRALRKRVVALRQEHPTWGAELLRVLLNDGRSKRDLPSARTFRRWLQGAGCQPAPRGRRPAAAREPATAPHDVWQIDAAEEIPLQGGQRASWLRIVDEYTGSVLGTWAFSPSPLESGSHSRGSKPPAFGVRNVGSAQSPENGQRASVGIWRRSANGTGIVVVGVRDRVDLECAGSPPAEWGGGTLARSWQELGGASDLFGLSGIAAALGQIRSPAARKLSARRRAVPAPNLSRTDQTHKTLSAQKRANALALGVGDRTSEPIRRNSKSRCQRLGLDLQPATIRRNQVRRAACRRELRCGSTRMGILRCSRTDSSTPTRTRTRCGEDPPARCVASWQNPLSQVAAKLVGQFFGKTLCPI